FVYCAPSMAPEPRLRGLAPPLTSSPDVRLRDVRLLCIVVAHICLVIIRVFARAALHAGTLCVYACVPACHPMCLFACTHVIIRVFARAALHADTIAFPFPWNFLSVF